MTLIASQRGQRAIAVLIYHGITPAFGAPAAPRERKYWIPEAVLRLQLEHIRYAGYRTAMFRELWTDRRDDGGRAAVVLTFDDGRASDYETAFPTVLQAGARAEFFVNTATIGRRGHLTWRQMEEMQRAGMSFQSHAHDHIVLLGLSPLRLEYQLRTSKDQLEQRLGRDVRFLAAPYGLLGRRVVESAWQIGYHGVCNSQHWPAQPGARVINRVAVHAHTTPEQFAGLLGARPGAYLGGFGRMALKELAKRFLLKVRPGALGIALSPERA